MASLMKVSDYIDPVVFQIAFIAFIYTFIGMRLGPYLGMTDNQTISACLMVPFLTITLRNLLYKK